MTSKDPIRPYETTQAASYLNLFVRTLSEFHDYMHQYEIIQESIIEPKNNPNLYRILTSAQEKIEEAMKIALRKAESEGTNENEKSGIAEFRLWLSDMVWNGGAFKLLISYWDEVDEIRGRHAFFAFHEYEKKISEDILGVDNDPTQSSTSDLNPILPYFNQLKQAFKQVESRPTQVKIFGNFLNLLRSFLEMTVLNIVFAAYIKQEENWQLISAMITFVLDHKDIADSVVYSVPKINESDPDLTVGRMKEEFKTLLDIKLSTKLDLGGTFSRALTIRVNKSIELCLSHQRQHILVQAINELMEQIRKYAVEFGEQVQKVWYEKIWEPLLNSLRVVGWIIMAPSLAIYDVCNGSNLYNEYNEKIAKAWEESPVMLVIGIAATVGLIAGVSVSFAAVTIPAIAHIGWGAGLFVSGLLIGGGIGYAYCHKDLQSIEDQKNQEIARIENCIKQHRNRQGELELIQNEDLVQKFEKERDRMRRQREEDKKEKETAKTSEQTLSSLLTTSSTASASAISGSTTTPPPPPAAKSSRDLAKQRLNEEMNKLRKLAQDALDQIPPEQMQQCYQEQLEKTNKELEDSKLKVSSTEAELQNSQSEYDELLMQCMQTFNSG
jgi:hypothetical protein